MLMIALIAFGYVLALGVFVMLAWRGPRLRYPSARVGEVVPPRPTKADPVDVPTQRGARLTSRPFVDPTSPGTSLPVWRVHSSSS